MKFLVCMVALLAAFACAEEESKKVEKRGILGGYGYGLGLGYGSYGIASAPVVTRVSHVAAAPIAYSAPIHAAPVAVAAPIAYSAPIHTVSAPVHTVAAAPISYLGGYGGYGYGGFGYGGLGYRKYW